MALATLYLGIDDTDTLESIGTGAMARELGAHLERMRMASVECITRHQLLVHPDIPYTSHNSAACLELRTDRSPRDIAGFAAGFVHMLFHHGADPAVCVADAARAAELSGFGARCQQQVVARSTADEIADATGVIALPLGGTGGGVIGATAACGLRATGTDGRFLAARGIRGIRGDATVAEILATTAIAEVIDVDGAVLAPGVKVAVDSDGGVRPELRGGRAVLVVRPRGDGSYMPVPKKKGEGDL
jgi:hypothetical protein